MSYFSKTKKHFFYVTLIKTRFIVFFVVINNVVTIFDFWKNNDIVMFLNICK